MAHVRIEQRNARLAAEVRIEYVKGREGDVAKATLTAISNTYRGKGEDRNEEATAIQWTLWGAQAENAAQYLGKGSRVNVVGRVRNNNYTNGEGKEVYAMAFTCEEIDYLDSKEDAQALKARQQEAAGEKQTPTPAKRTRTGKAAR